MTTVYLAGTPPDLVGQNRWITGPEKIVQAVTIRLGRFRGEWLLDPSSGLPWMEWVGKKKLTEREVLEQVRFEILRTAGVLGINNLSFVQTGTDGVLTGEILIADPVNQSTTVFGINIQATGRVTVL
jgi:hypothetical protein